MVKPADKNCGLVLLSTLDYETMCFTHHNDINIYRAFDSASFNFQRIYARLRNILNIHDRLFKKPNSNPRTLSKLALALLQLEDRKSLRLGAFYCLPKVHKSRSPPYPGRPIVSTPSTMTYHTSVYYYLYCESILLFPYHPMILSVTSWTSTIKAPL